MSPPARQSRSRQANTLSGWVAPIALIGVLLTSNYAATPVSAANHATPLVELPAAAADNDILAIVLSGDGGWADLDRDFGRAFQIRGLSTVGFDCLKYFWQARTPDEASRDLNAVLRDYLRTWHKQRLLLVGFSFGASWLPFIVNRLPPDLRARVRLVVLLSPGKYANVEVKVDDWFTDEHRPDALDVVGEATRMHLPVLCVYGAEQEAEALCPVLDARKVRILRMPGGHHFNHDYTTVEAAILRYLDTAPQPP